jgi:hypothetical protein
LGDGATPEEIKRSRSVGASSYLEKAAIPIALLGTVERLAVARRSKPRPESNPMSIAREFAPQVEGRRDP